ncbi:MAG TPA: hypothetical protein VN577_23280 [Terriglobales bacterium]|nr:hypothetical protein [Terriglobales bacterium]
MVIAPALSLVPVAVSLLMYPAFAYARLLGLLLLPVMAVSEVAGFSRLAETLRSEFDVLSFFAVGVIVTLLVVVASSGVLLAIVITN